MIVELDPRLIPLTQKLAKEIDGLKRWDGERPLKEWRVAFLKAKLDDGLFHTPVWAIAHLNGERYRNDGQHSSRMLANLTVNEFPKAKKALLLEFKVDCADDMADLFNQFNQRESVRSNGEIINAHAKTEPRISGIKPTWIEKATAGIMCWANEGRIRMLQTNERPKVMHENVEFVEFVHQFVKTRRLSKPGVIAAIYATYLKNDDEAHNFWAMVRDETAAEPKHPSRIISNFLKENELGSSTSRMSQKWTPRAVMVKCVHAWNAYRKNEKTDLKYYADAPIPEVL